MMIRMVAIVVVFFVCCIPNISAAEPLAAFPGASGGGCYAVGGRGGKVIEVTNLNSSGPGSFREACEAKGPRVVIFKVAGIIDLKGKSIYIRNPYITIAGQTAPTGGITIRGHEIRISTHDVIIRYLRVRVGRNEMFGLQEGDAIAIADNAQNVIIDHCSLSWSNDENVQIWTTKSFAHHITFSWNIIAEGLSYKHASCGMIIGSESYPEQIHDITLHHNLFMNLYNRLPLIKSKNAKIINNILYNWDQFATAVSGGAQVDIISNLYKAGPLNRQKDLMEIKIYPFDGKPTSGVSGTASIYMVGNLGPNQPQIEKNNKGMVRLIENTAAVNQGYVERSAPFKENNIDVTVDPATDLEAVVLPGVGANARIDSNGKLISSRDRIDKRMIKEYKSGSGKIPETEKAVGGYPINLFIAGDAAYLDSDKDGMSDNYENQNGLDRLDPEDGKLDADGDGYTNLEEFLNGTN